MAVNVIIPVHNTPINLFERALASLGTQIKPGFIVTVVDDASTEENTKKYRAASDEYFFNVNYIKSEENIGPGQARQLGMDNAWPSIDYFMFLDADDILQPRAIDILYSEAKVRDADVVFSEILCEGSHRTQNSVIKIGSNTTWLHGKIYKRTFLEKYNIRFLPMKIYNEDSYFNLVATCLAEKKFSVNEILYIWSYNKDSITRRVDSDEFDRLHGVEYYLTQVKAVHKVLAHKEMDFGRTLANLYVSYQRNLLFDGFFNKEFDRLTREFFSHPYIREHLYDERVMEDFIAGAAVGKGGKLFIESASEWLNKFRSDMIWENQKS